MDHSNSSWEPMPSYLDLLNGMVDFVDYFWKRSAEMTPSARFRSLQEENQFTCGDLKCVVLIAVALTGLRHFCTRFIFKPVCKRFDLLTSSREKMPESSWKFFFYVFSSFFAFYLVAIKNKFFQRPELMWNDWTLHGEIPSDIYILLTSQIGYYLHSMYATLFLDTWRKDSLMLIAHHLVTLMLTYSSLAFRYHNIGALIIFCHDVTDVLMEFSKLNVYFKYQSGELVKYHEILSNASFLTFVLMWVVSRLYWFPLKAIYALTVTAVPIRDILPALVLSTFLLWLLLAMNIIWFKMIVDLVIRVFTGKMKAVDDTREYDVVKNVYRQSSGHQNGTKRLHSQNGTAEDKNSFRKRIIQQDRK